MKDYGDIPIVNGKLSENGTEETKGSPSQSALKRLKFAEIVGAANKLVRRELPTLC